MPKDMLETYFDKATGLSAKQKAGLVVSGLTLLAAAFSSGLWVQRSYFENRELGQLDRKVDNLEKTKSSLEETNSTLTLEKQELQEKLKNINTTRLPNQIAPLNTIPPFDEAPLDETTAEDMGADWFTHQALYASTTTINSPPFYKKFAGRKFKFEGVLVDVLSEGSETCSVLEVITHRTLPDDFQEVDGKPVVRTPDRRSPFSFRCYFSGDEYKHQLETFLPRHHTLTVSGVMDEYGNLRRCKIDNIQDGFVPQLDWIMEGRTAASIRKGEQLATLE